MAGKLPPCSGSIKRPAASGRNASEFEKQIQPNTWKPKELQAIYSHAPLFLCVLDPERRVLFVNRAFCAFAGAREKELLNGRACGVFGCINAKESPRGCGFGKGCRSCGLRLAIEDTCKTGRRHKNVEYRAVLERNGVRREVALLGTTVRITSKDQVRILLCLQDITGFRRLEESLRESEEQYRGMVEDQTEVICRFKADGTFTYVNETYCRFFGKADRQLVGKKWHPRACREDLPEIEKRLRKLTPSNPVAVIENRVRAKNGRVHWMQFINRGLFDPKGRLLEIQSVGRDITELKRAEQELREREARFHSIFEHSMAGILFTSPDGRIFSANPAACRMLGRTEKEICRIGRQGLTEKEDPHVAAFLRERLEKGFAAGELNFIRSDGTRLPVRISSALFQSKDGIRTSMVFQDISASKSARGRIHAFSRKLLSAREEEKRHFSAVLHHEVGSTAVSLAAYLDAAESHLKRGNRKEAVEAITKCRRVFAEAADNLKSLAVELRPPALDLLGLPAALQQLFQRIMQEAPLKISFYSSIQYREISPGIQTFLFRTVQECLTNVVKHANARRVRVRISGSGPWLTLSVKDSGRGFDPDRPAVDPNRRLGLRSIQEWVEGLGGKMDIASKPGNGTRITILVPSDFTGKQGRT